MWTVRVSPNIVQNMKYITIEPAMFLQMAGDTLNYVIYQNLFIDKICLTELHYTKEICTIYSQLGNLKEDDPQQAMMEPIVKDIQQASSSFVLYNSLVENSFPVILVLFLGVWSDAKRRRKPPLLLSLLGKLCRAVGLFLNAWFMQWPTIYLLLMAALPHSLGGSNAVFHMAAFSYIADTSSPRNRTWRLGCAEAFWQLGTPVGLVLGAYLFRTGGYLCVFGTSMLFHLVAVLYTAFLLPEVPQPKRSQFTVGKHGWYGTWDTSFDASTAAKRNRYYSENDIEPAFSQDPTAVPNPDSDETASLVSKVSFKPNGPTAPPIPELSTIGEVSVKEFILGAIHSIVKPRPNHTRKCLFALGFIMLLVGLGHHGELNLRYLFARNKFQWREQQFTNWVFFESMMVVVGITVLMPIVSKVLKLSDPCAGALAGLTRFVSRGIYAFANTPAVLYLGSIAEIPGILGGLSARSLASKCVLRDERGRVFAFLGCIEALVPLLAVALYSQVYSYTLDTAPSAIYFLSCGIYLTIFVTFIILFVAMKMKIIQFTGTDLSSLTDPLVGIQTIPGTTIPYCYRRTSLS